MRVAYAPYEEIKVGDYMIYYTDKALYNPTLNITGNLVSRKLVF